MEYIMLFPHKPLTISVTGIADLSDEGLVADRCKVAANYVAGNTTVDRITLVIPSSAGPVVMRGIAHKDAFKFLVDAWALGHMVKQTLLLHRTEWSKALLTWRKYHQDAKIQPEHRAIFAKLQLLETWIDNDPRVILWEHNRAIGRDVRLSMATAFRAVAV